MGVLEAQKAWLDIATSITERAPLERTDLVEQSCPRCQTASLFFSFTLIKSQPIHYGLYVVCSNCGSSIHFRLAGKPQGFHNRLIMEAFQRLEDEVRTKAKPD